jgi:protein-tyrosine phosphatase
MELDFNDDPVPLLKRFWEIVEKIAYAKSENITL